uniref:Ig-like domain-containing protein n=1 Tax=Oryzias melastigma TaxID=30732 RepID=A0A3B3DY90_ORYME
GRPEEAVSASGPQHSERLLPPSTWIIFPPAFRQALQNVTQKPSWSQMFRGETITLTCEVQGGEGVQWEYEWRTPQSQTFRTNRKDWTFTASISGDYSCKSRPTDDSYSSWILSDSDPVHPVTEGHSVTLGCKWRTENLLSKVFFYQNDTLIQSESRVEMIIPAVSKSHEGFYKCQSSGKESPQSWLATILHPQLLSNSTSLCFLVDPQNQQHPTQLCVCWNANIFLFFHFCSVFYFFICDRNSFLKLPNMYS